MLLLGSSAAGCTRISPPHRQWWKRRLSTTDSALNENDCRTLDAIERCALGTRSTPLQTGTWTQHVHPSMPKVSESLSSAIRAFVVKAKEKNGFPGVGEPDAFREAWSSIGAFGALSF